MFAEIKKDNVDSTTGLRSHAAPVIERAPLPIIEVQGPAHTVSYVNSAFCRLVGKTRGELVGNPFDQIVPGGDKCVPILDQVYVTGEAATHAQEDESAATPAQWLYAMWPALDAEEHPVGVIIQLTKAVNFRLNAAAVNEALLITALRQHELVEEADKLNAQLTTEIGERKKSESALSEAVEDLKHAHVLANRAIQAKEDFMAALSHELRTPLTPVLLAAAGLREDQRLPADAREQLGMMERNLALEARLIDDLLDVTAISHGKLQVHAQPCDAHSLIGLAIEIVREDARVKEISIDRSFTAQHSGLLADPARFQQVMWNLLRNAIKFTPRGGKISIHTREEHSPQGAVWLRIEVNDSGIGIDSERLVQIFLPFDQGSFAGAPNFGGMGLGLAIASAVVELHGGRISAQSPGLNLGSTFVVELPGAVAPESGVENPAARFSFPAASTRIAPLRLLVVEDHASTLQALTRLLQLDGHHVIAARSVAAALTAAAAEKFDLVISDLGLPDGSGNELMEKLRAKYGLSGIALSGYGMEDDLVRSRTAGFVTHMVKPVSIAELRRVLAKIR